MTCNFIGFSRLPVGDAAAIIFSNPIFVMLYSHVILREHCDGLLRLFVLGLMMAGVLLIAKPGFLNVDNSVIISQDMFGFGAALAGSVCM